MKDDTAVSKQPKPHTKGLYDPDQLKEIPILSVCAHLSIPIEKHYHQKAWCKVRKERTASTCLNLDKNTFYDFGGGGEGGDVIAFYAYATGVSQGEAMQALGRTFGLTPLNPRAGLSSNELTFHEWSVIGIQGDRASKNFSYDLERLSIDRLWELSEYYNMPVNELRKKHPKTYERILRQKALPYLRTLRNMYYLDVYREYRLCVELKAPTLFQDASIQQELSKKKETLVLAERLFLKAIEGTSILYQQGKSYDANTVLRQLLRGEPKLGTRSYTAMQALARKQECYLKYRTMPIDVYQSSDCSEIPHIAFIKGDRISMGFLPEAEPIVDKALCALKEHDVPMRLTDRIPSHPSSLSRAVHTERDR